MKKEEIQSSLGKILPVQFHYYVIKLKRPRQHGPYAFFGGNPPGLLVFPLLEKAEQFCMTVAKGNKPKKISARELLHLLAKAGAIALADGLKVTVGHITTMGNSEVTQELESQKDRRSKARMQVLTALTKKLDGMNASQLSQAKSKLRDFIFELKSDMNMMGSAEDERAAFKTVEDRIKNIPTN